MDVALIHIASMSNLMAALGWAIVDLLVHPAQLRQVADGDSTWRSAARWRAPGWHSARSCPAPSSNRWPSTPARESSDVPPGWTIATLLPLLNTSAAPGWRRGIPRWHRHRLADTGGLASPMLVTAFGHGRHSCPAQPFSLSAMTMAMTRLLGCYDMTPEWAEYPRPVPAQIGGVARSADPCPIGYVYRGNQGCARSTFHSGSSTE